MYSLMFLILYSNIPKLVEFCNMTDAQIKMPNRPIHVEFLNANEIINHVDPFFNYVIRYPIYYHFYLSFFGKLNVFNTLQNGMSIAFQFSEYE